MCSHHSEHGPRHSAHACALSHVLAAILRADVHPRRVIARAPAMATLALIRAENNSVAQSHLNNTEGVLRAMFMASSSQRCAQALPKARPLFALPHRSAGKPRAYAPLAPNARDNHDPAASFQSPDFEIVCIIDVIGFQSKSRPRSRRAGSTKMNGQSNESTRIVATAAARHAKRAAHGNGSQ